MRSFIIAFFIIPFISVAQNHKSGTIKVQKPASDTALTIVDHMPEFPGGSDSLLAFINSNFKYPKSALEEGLRGTCYTTFIINTDGTISDVLILRGISQCPECDLEVLRLVSVMPKWIPGSNQGKLVKVRVNFPLKLSLK